MELNEDYCPVCKKDMIFNNKVVFQIGHNTKSCTASPGFMKHKGIYFVDCPGLQDQDKAKEYPNQTAVHLIQKNSKASIIMLVIGCEQLVAKRGAPFAEQITGILRQIGPDCNKSEI